MDINDIPGSQLAGSRTMPAMYYRYGEEPSWFKPGSRFDGDLQWLVGNALRGHGQLDLYRPIDSGAPGVHVWGDVPWLP